MTTAAISNTAPIPSTTIIAPPQPLFFSSVFLGGHVQRLLCGFGYGGDCGVRPSSKNRERLGTVSPPAPRGRAA
jgi:hypothetical protein